MHKQSTLASAGLCAGLLVFAVLPVSAAWTLNDTQTRLTDGNWTLTVAADGQDLTITASAAATWDDLDLTDVERDTAVDDAPGYRVTAIGAAAFKQKTIKSITAPDVVTIANGSSAANGAFYSAGLTNVSFAALTTIGNYAFQSCSGLTRAKFPSVTAIGNYAFSGCGAFTNIEVNADIASIGSYAFARTSSFQACVLKSFQPTTLPKLEMIGEKAFFGSSGSNLQGDFYCPALTNLGFQALRQSAITSFRAPKLTYLGDNAFSACASLTDVEVSADITYIGASAFARTSTGQTCVLKTFHPTTLPRLEMIGAQAFYGKNGSALEGDFHCPALTNLGNQALSSSKITSFRAPALTNLLAGTFQNCQSLTNVDIGAVISIGDRAFNHCGGLTNVVLCADIVSIGIYAFADETNWKRCWLKGLQPTTLPKLVSIGNNAFQGNQGCDLEGEFTFPALTSLGASAFPKSKITAFRAPKLESVGASALSDCTMLSNVVIRGGGTLGNSCITGMKCRALIDVLGPAPTSIGTTAISASTKNAANKDNPYPQVRVAHVRDLDGWKTLDGVTFTPFETARENATHRKYLGDTPEKRTKGLITGRGTFWLVDADSNKATYLSLR